MSTSLWLCAVCNKRNNIDLLYCDICDADRGSDAKISQIPEPICISNPNKDETKENLDTFEISASSTSTNLSWIECCPFPFRVKSGERGPFIIKDNNSFISFTERPYSVHVATVIMSMCHMYDCIKNKWLHIADIDLQSRADQHYTITPKHDHDKNCEIYSLSFQGWKHSLDSNKKLFIILENVTFYKKDILEIGCN